MPLIAISSDNFDDFKADKYIKKKSNKQDIYYWANKNSNNQHKDNTGINSSISIGSLGNLHCINRQSIPTQCT